MNDNRGGLTPTVLLHSGGAYQSTGCKRVSEKCEELSSAGLCTQFQNGCKLMGYPVGPCQQMKGKYYTGPHPCVSFFNICYYCDPINSIYRPISPLGYPTLDGDISFCQTAVWFIGFHAHFISVFVFNFFKFPKDPDLPQKYAKN